MPKVPVQRWMIDSGRSHDLVGDSDACSYRQPVNNNNPPIMLKKAHGLVTTKKTP